MRPIRLGCLSLAAAVGLMLVLPWLLADMLAGALIKLHLGARTAGMIVLGILAGSLVNIPVRRVVRSRLVPLDPLAVFGLHDLWPAIRRARTETIVAVNVGGCLIPTALALYEIGILVAQRQAIGALIVAILVNVYVCYKLARPVARVGIAMPGLVPPAVAALTALIAAPAHATPVAFVAGVLGPLIGADVLHLGDVERIDSGILSIGGAGTFDGILLSGIVAIYLA